MSDSSKVAGCVIEEGKVSSKSFVKIIRNEEKIHECEIQSLRREKIRLKRYLVDLNAVLFFQNSMISSRMTKWNFMLERKMKKNLSLEKLRKKKKSRIDKISSLIKRTVAEVFLTQNFHDTEGKIVLLSVCNVFLSGDGKTATVYIDTLNNSVQNNYEEVLKAIENNSVKIRKEFSSKIELRYTPKLRFEVLKDEMKKTEYGK